MITKYDNGYPIICPQAGPQEMFCSSPADIVIYGGQAYGGKAQPVSSMVCTPFGFRRMGEMYVGAQVSNPDGSVARVIAIHPQGIKRVYKVTFNDGATCECAEGHLWLYRLGRKTRKTENQWYVGTIEELKRKLEKDYVMIPLTEPIQFTLPARNKKSVFPIDPYFLGVLIGDGCLSEKQVSITTADKEIVDKIEIKYHRVYTKPDNLASSYHYKWDDVKVGLNLLGIVNKKSHEKFVPKQYKNSSVDDRYKLLQGLMDTDGFVDDRGHGSYTTTSQQLAIDVQYIARSLGYTASITTKLPTYSHNGIKKNGLIAYTVWIGGRNIEKIVSIKRKVVRCSDKLKNGRSIESIEYVRDDECQCITVDHPNGLYITDDFIVTHNSFALLMEGGSGVGDPLYTGVIFRRKFVEITQGGGLWDTSETIYPSFGGVGVRGNVEWVFPSGCRFKFAHLNHENNIYDYMGSAFVFMGFDELTHFTRKQFFYLMSRNRPPAGCTLKPYIRATCNAEPGWVADLIQWWWDPHTGYPIKERSGKIRHFIRQNDEIVWVSPDYKDEDGLPPKSITFISSAMEDNPLGMLADPTYKANINAMDKVSRERLGKGNWLIQEGGNMFKPEWFEIVDSLPPGIKLVRYWDFAATEVKEKDKNDPDWTAGALVGYHDGILYIADIDYFRSSPGTTEKKIVQHAKMDGHDVEIWWEEEKGASGKMTSEYLAKVFKGFDAHPDPVSGQKVERAKPWSALAEQGRVKLLRGEWIRQFLTWASNFPDGKRDTIDAVSGAFKVITGPNRVFKYYRSDDDGNFRTFRKEKEDFEKITKENLDIYAVLYADEEGGIYGATYLYSKVTGRLRQYNEIVCPDPVAGIVASELIDKVVVPVYDKPNYVSLKKIFCNETMMEYGKGTMNKEFKKYGIRMHLNTIYDEPGSILTLNRLMANNEFILHSDCTETDVQIRGWMYENKKTKPGYPLARALCLLVSQLKSTKEIKPPEVIKQYSGKKMQIREKLRSSGLYTNTNNNNDEQYDYLIK